MNNIQHDMIFQLSYHQHHIFALSRLAIPSSFARPAMRTILETLAVAKVFHELDLLVLISIHQAAVMN